MTVIVVCSEQEGRHRSYSADLTNLAGLQALLESRERAVNPVFASVLSFSCRGVVCVAIWSQVKKSDDQINLTFSEVEEMWIRLTCDFEAVPDNQRQF